MKRAQRDFDWLVVELGVTAHIRGFLAGATGSPELLEERYPEFQNPEIPIEQALRTVISHSSATAEAFGWDETPGLLARTILPWIDCLRDGGYHPVPVSALHHFLDETTVPFFAEEIDTIVARAEVNYAMEQEGTSPLSTRYSNHD